MRSWGVQGRSWGGPGARGVPSGAPGLDFGPPRAPFWVTFWSNFWCVLQYFFEAISGSVFDAVLVPFGSHFWVVLETFLVTKFRYEKCYVFEGVPGANVGAPGDHHRVKKLDFHWSVA